MVLLAHPSSSNLIGGCAHAKPRSLRAQAHANPRPSTAQHVPLESRRASPLIGVLAGLAVLGMPGVASADIPSVLAGVPRVVDGDTLVVNGSKIRMYGIDAPESKQVCLDPKGSPYACGQQAAAALAARVGGGAVNCSVKNQDQYGRFVAQCAVNGKDLGEYMVSNGYAVAYRQYSKEYGPLEDSAKAGKKGIWSGNFTVPSEWRKVKKAEGEDKANALLGAPAAAAAAPLLASLPAAGPAPPPAPAAGPAPGGCNIKGNIGRSGDKYYYSPGDRNYGAVKIDEAKGERYFCTEAEARAAGWTQRPVATAAAGGSD